MTRVLIALVMVALTAGEAAGGAAEQAARQLYRLTAADMGVDIVIERIRDGMVAAVVRDIEARLDDDLEAEERQALSAGISRLLSRHFSPATFEDNCVAIYLKYFTAEELDALVRFYASPVGRKSLDLSAVLMKEMLVAGQQAGLRLGQSPELRRELLEEIRRALPGRARFLGEQQS